MQSETDIRRTRKIKRLRTATKIEKEKEKELETFDYSAVTGITASKMAKFCTGEFITNKSNIVFYGPFGVGKSHLATGLLLKLCEQGFRCRFYDTHKLITDLLTHQKQLELTKFTKALDRYDVLVCDELGYVPHNNDGANLYFQLISERYERKSTIFTTNLTFSEWDKVFLDQITTSAAVDRILHRCEIINIEGTSYRAKQAKNNQGN